jgi:hypothetical protein
MPNTQEIVVWLVAFAQATMATWLRWWNYWRKSQVFFVPKASFAGL